MISAVLPTQIQQREVFQPKNERQKWGINCLMKNNKDAFVPSFKGDFNLPVSALKKIGEEYIAKLNKTPEISEKGYLLIDYVNEIIAKSKSMIEEEAKSNLKTHSVTNLEAAAKALQAKYSSFLQDVHHEYNGSFFQACYTKIDNLEESRVSNRHKLADDYFKRMVNHVNTTTKLFQFFLEKGLDNKESTVGAKKVFRHALNLVKDKLLISDMNLKIENKHILRKYSDTTYNDYKNFFSITNAIDNAGKYSPNGEEIKVGFKTKDNRLYVVVSDKGIGILKEDKDKVLRPNVRGSNVEGIVGSGHGFGQITNFLEPEGLKIEITSPLYPEAKKFKGAKIEIPLFSKIEK